MVHMWSDKIWDQGENSNKKRAPRLKKEVKIRVNERGNQVNPKIIIYPETDQPRDPTSTSTRKTTPSLNKRQVCNYSLLVNTS